MSEIYDEQITRDTDWGGDESTGGAPVSGRRVQEYIKGEITALETRLGNLVVGEGGTVTEMTHPVTVMQTEEADFILVDDNERTLLTIDNGHIRTANGTFDSATLESRLPDNPWYGKTLGVIGDSISHLASLMEAGGFYSEHSGYGVTENNIWWRLVKDKLGFAHVNNASLGGSTMSDFQTTTFANGTSGCAENRITLLGSGGKAPDVVVVYIGTNDWYNNKEVGELTSTTGVPSASALGCFAPAYLRCVLRIQELYPTARVVCCTIPDQHPASGSWPPVNGNGNSIPDFNDVISRVCSLTGATLCELHACGINYRSASLYIGYDGQSPRDQVHPNYKGHGLIARTVINTLRNI